MSIISFIGKGEVKNVHLLSNEFTRYFYSFSVTSMYEEQLQVTRESSQYLRNRQLKDHYKFKKISGFLFYFL